MQIFRCSQKQCNGRGRCRAKNILPPLKCELAYQPETICICDEGFMGEHCELLQSSVIPQTQIEINDLSTPLTTTPLEIEDQTSPLRITPSPSTTPTISKFLKESLILKYSSFCIFFLKKVYFVWNTNVKMAITNFSKLLICNVNYKYGYF